MQDEQFKTEIKNLEAMQTSAYDHVRFHRLVQKRVRMEIKRLYIVDKAFLDEVNELFFLLGTLQASIQ
jgi:hypothetical protein